MLFYQSFISILTDFSSYGEGYSVWLVLYGRKGRCFRAIFFLPIMRYPNDYSMGGKVAWDTGQYRRLGETDT